MQTQLAWVTPRLVAEPRGPQFHSGSNLHVHVRFSQLCRAGCDTATWTHVTLPVGLCGHSRSQFAQSPGPGTLRQRSLTLLDRLGVSEGPASLAEAKSHPSRLSLSIFQNTGQSPFPPTNICVTFTPEAEILPTMTIPLTPPALSLRPAQYALTEFGNLECVCKSRK